MRIFCLTAAIIRSQYRRNLLMASFPRRHLNTATQSEKQPPTYADLRNKVALVTGVGQTKGSDNWGNGAAIARVLAQNGVKVFGCDLNLESAKYTSERIEKEGGEISVTQTDVTKGKDVQKLVAACVERYGKIDILVNNVGRSERGDPTTMDEDVWTKQIDVNLTSTYLCCRAVLPIMEKQGSGAVVNISSIAGLRYIGKPQVAYSTSKAALIQFTKTTAVVFGQSGIRLNTVVPGLIHTPLVEMLANKYANGDYEGFVASRHKAVPMGHMGSAHDVAYAVTFLASDQARYITAQELVVDGGITAVTPA